MSDFDLFTVEVTRGELGLNPLQLNDHLNYIVADQILGGTQGWNRQTVKSPFVDGEFTVQRSRGGVQEKLGVQVLGDSQTTLAANLGAAVDAFSQFRYQLSITMDAVTRTYQCQTADYVTDWTAPRWMARQVLVTFDIPRYPGEVVSG